MPRSSKKTPSRIAAVYIRTATAQALEQLEEQSRAILDYAAANRIRVVRTFHDIGKLGNDVSGREGLPALLDAAKRGRPAFTVLLVYEPARLARDPEVAASCERQLQEAGISIEYVTLGAPSAVRSMQLAMSRLMAEERRKELALRRAKRRGSQ